jgi:putative sugar O-methyltransferase
MSKFKNLWTKNKYNFKKFWVRNKYKLDLNNELIKMIDCFIQSESYKLVSKYWHYLNIRNLSQLKNKNLENYSTSVAKNYYTFIDVTEDQIKQAMINVENTFPSEKINLFKKQAGLSYVESMKYNNLTYLLWLNLRNSKSFDKLDKLSDEGYLSYNDPYIKINDSKITSDKINSLLDYEKINKFSNFSNIQNILEIGAGSGRTSQAILTSHSNIKYTICDIPPALFVSYERLKKVFNTKKIGLLYDLQDSVELNNSINNFDISFIMPHQLNLIKNNNFDLTIAIDCIHEMDKKTIQNYFTNINNISKLFYFSVWKKTTVPFSGILRKFSFFGILKKYENNLDYFNNDYNIPKNWLKNFEEDLVFPSNFICSGYEIKK